MPPIPSRDLTKSIWAETLRGRTAVADHHLGPSSRKVKYHFGPGLLRESSDELAIVPDGSLVVLKMIELNHLSRSGGLQIAEITDGSCVGPFSAVRAPIATKI